MSPTTSRVRRRVAAALAAASAVPALVVGLVLVPVLSAQAVGVPVDVTPPVNPWLPTAPPLESGGSAFQNAQNLSEYMIDVRGAALYDSMPDYAKAAWSKQYAAQAAQSAGMYRAGLAYDNVGAETLAEVVPIVGSQYVLPRTPAFSAAKFLKPTGPQVGALTAAATAFAMRADISDSVASWFGIDANQTVCADPVAGGSNFVNFITGQDCTAFKNAPTMTPNLDVTATTPGWLGSLYATGYHYSGTLNYWQCVVNEPGGIMTAAGSFTCAVDPASGTQTLNGTNTAWCKPATGNPQGQGLAITPTPNWVHGTGAAVITFSWNCPAGAALYSINNAPTNSGGWDTRNACMLTTPATCATFNYWATGSTWRATYPGIDADPQRYLHCTMTFSNGTSASGNSPTFHESSGAFPAPVCPTIPTGLTATHLKVEEVGGGTTNVLEDEDTTANYQAHGAADKALCATQACLLDLSDLTTGKSCFSEGDTCDGWLTDPDRDTKYACTYGGQADSFSDCYVYAQVFNTAQRQAGAPYADPHTGNDPESQTGFSEDQLNLERPAQSPADVYRSCFGGTYSAFNPLEWVVKPIQCGLEWAFIPDPTTIQADQAQIADAWNETPPGQVVTAVTAWTFTAPASGCSGISFDDSWLFAGTGGGSHTMTIMQACPGDMLAGLAGWSRIFMNLAFAVGAVLAITRHVGGIFGFGGLGKGDES